MRSIRTALLVASLSITACGAPADEDAEVAADSADTADVTSALTATTTAPLSGMPMTGAAAASSAAAAATSFTPAGCATATVTQNTVVYTLSGCSGPYGLALVKGTISATFSPQLGGAIKVDLSAPSLETKHGKVAVAATALVMGSSAQVTTTTSATSTRGRTVSHTGSYGASWDGSCLSLSGSFTTTAGAKTWATTVTGYKRCQGQCPQSGTIAISAAASQVTLTFSGSTSATVSGSGGRQGTVPLLCGG